MALQKNEISIQPISTWVHGTNKTLNVLKLNSFYRYDFNDCPGAVQYFLGNTIEYTNENNELIIEFNPIVDGNIELPAELVETWGSDDTPIFDYVLQQLQLTRP